MSRVRSFKVGEYGGTRVIVTNVWATQKNKDIFNSVIGQMSDGIWENANLNGYWYMTNIGEFNNLITIEVKNQLDVKYFGGNYITNRFYYKTDDEVVKFFSNKIRKIVKIEDNDNLEESLVTEEQWKNSWRGYNGRPYDPTPRLDYSWKKGNCTTTEYLDYNSGVTVGDAYDVVAALKEWINGGK